MNAPCYLTTAGGEILPVIWLRHKYPGPNYPKWGPKAEDHPSIGMACVACGVPFVAGDFTVGIPLGPGRGDVEKREKCRQGGWYNAVAVEVHWACATGEEVE